jgi:hypothetical protein
MTMVAGELLVSNFRLANQDVTEIVADARAGAATLATRAGLR